MVRSLAYRTFQLRWRAGAGRGIVEAASAAVDAATAGGAWDNAPVLAGAPHSATIGTYIAESGRGPSGAAS